MLALAAPGLYAESQELSIPQVLCTTPRPHQKQPVLFSDGSSTGDERSLASNCSGGAIRGDDDDDRGSLASLDWTDALEDDAVVRDDACSDASTEVTCSAPTEQVLRALALQRELLGVLRSPAFQSELLSLLRDCGPDVADFQEGCQALCGTATRELLLKHGFEGSAVGFAEALQQLQTWAVDSDALLDGMESIYDCLGGVPPWRSNQCDGFAHLGSSMPMAWSM